MFVIVYFAALLVGSSVAAYFNQRTPFLSALHIDSCFNGAWHCRWARRP